MDTNQNPPNTYTIPATPASPIPPVSEVPSVPPIVPPIPKKTIPKVAIFAGIGVLVLIIIFAIFKILTSTSTSKISGGTITWWGLWEDPKAVQPLIDAYQTAHSGVKINYIKESPQDYRERLTSSLAKSSGPDIFTFHNSWVPMFKGSLDSLPASVMNPADFAKTFYPITSSDLTSGSSIVGIPLEYDALTLFINQDIFDKAGKTAPTSWDDFRSVAKQLTVKDDQGVITQSGAAMGRTENIDHWPEILALLMLQNGVSLSNPTGPGAEGALTYFTLFSTTDGIWDATLPSSTQSFAAGKLAMYIGPSWRAFDIQAQNPNLKFKTVPIPQLPKDSPSQADITYATYWASGVWSGSSHKAAAWDFLKFLSTQDSLTKLYQNESKVRSFGEPYPRVDMASLLSSHPVLGSIISQAPGATSWYLASRTFDGPTGINSQMINYFGDAVNAVANGTSTADKALATAAQGVSQILAQYKLIAK
ncbi:MAG TPA: extracellular solute-binding protein [Patescibacteria group bacterium]|nr:extracellular solute-binding protein [Patescibacteria group bacterium]